MLYEVITDAATDLSMAVRPEYIWDEHNKSGFEVSWFKRTEHQEGNDTTIHGNKFTLAHIISMGKSQFLRPELRFYTTYLKADGELPFADNKDHQLSFGAQMEARITSYNVCYTKLLRAIASL